MSVPVAPLVLLRQIIPPAKYGRTIAKKNSSRRTVPVLEPLLLWAGLPLVCGCGPGPGAGPGGPGGPGAWSDKTKTKR